MNKKYLYQIKQTQDHISIHLKNCVQIIHHAVKSKRIYTTYKKISPAHLIDPVKMYRNIRCTISISKDQLSAVNPEKRRNNCTCQYPLQGITYHFAIKETDCIFQHSDELLPYSVKGSFYSHAALEKFSASFCILYDKFSQRNPVHSAPDQHTQNHSKQHKCPEIGNMEQLNRKYNIYNIEISKCITHQKLL